MRNVTSIITSLIGFAAAVHLGYTAIKYINKCDKLEAEIKKLKEASASN